MRRSTRPENNHSPCPLCGKRMTKQEKEQGLCNHCDKHIGAVAEAFIPEEIGGPK